MSITAFQRDICQLIAKNRISSGESYIAGGVALNTLLNAPRLSNDIDIFNDTAEAVQASWLSDAALLSNHGFTLSVRTQFPSFIEALASKGNDKIILQWAQDSAYRFFPLQEHPEFGLTLHPFDLATNKVLALVGRLEVRDWIDTISCAESIQPLGYLAWSAAGKDIGLGPSFILEQAARTARYTQLEVNLTPFSTEPPSAATLSIQWRRMLNEAREVIDILPGEHTGKCLFGNNGTLLKATSSELPGILKNGDVLYHEGSLQGAYPTFKMS